MIAPYVTIEGKKEYERNKTGFGYMVMDIAQAIGRLEEVELLTTDTRGGAFIYQGVKFWGRSVELFVKNIFHCLPLSLILRLKKDYTLTLGSFVRIVYYWLMTGYLYARLTKGHYEIVHIHGCGFATELWMNVCKKCNQKFVVTLHGLNSFSDTVKLEPAGKLYERNFLKRVVEGEFPITVISTGMKRLVEKTLRVEDCKNIEVVCNSFNFSDNNVELDIRANHGIPSERKVLVCIGNVCSRKNQGQLISAFKKLTGVLARDTYILFLGDNTQPDYTIESLSANNPWRDHFLAVGVVSKKQIASYYKQCDAVALMSLSEGFGLSLIEGMHFGKPCICFEDIDAFEDIYNARAMIGVKAHTDDAVAAGLTVLLTKEWDSEFIRAYSSKFEKDNMAKQYVEVYEKVRV